MAVNDVTIESQAVGAGAPITVHVIVENDVEISSLVLPLEVRTVSGGSYMANNTLTLTIANRIFGGPLLGLATLTYHSTPDAQFCSGPTSSSWGGDGDQGASSNDGSPDAVFWVGVSISGSGLTPGADGAGNGSIVLDMGTNGSVGDFIIDTMCKGPANHFGMVDFNTSQAVPGVTFRAGVITQLPDQCPLDQAAATDPVNATVGSQANNTITATTFSLIS